MKMRSCCLSVLGLVLLGTTLAAGEEIVSTTVPAMPVPDMAAGVAGGCAGCKADIPPGPAAGPFDRAAPQCNPHCNLFKLYVDNGVKNPFEMYARFGPSFVTSGGDLDDVLHTGIALDVGVKTFCYNADGRGGWYGELGVDYIFNNTYDQVPIIERFPVVQITQNVGTFAEVQRLVPARDFLSITELHRVYAKVGGGYQWYWGSDDPAQACYFADLDAGFRLGHAHAATHLIRRIYLQDIRIRDRDIVDNTGEMNVTDFIKNVYIGGGIGMLIPFCGFDVVAGFHAEYSHDIIRLPTISARDDGLDQIKVEILLGMRY